MAPLATRLLRSRRVWVAAIAIGLGWAVLWFATAHPRRGGGLRRLDPGSPFQLELGRGSGLYGLDTVEVLDDGTVILHRIREEDAGGTRRPFVETTTLRLSAKALADVRVAVEENGLLGLYKEYRDPRVADGTQWVLRVRQGGQEKSVYCDNSFPRQLVRFAEALDRILAGNGLQNAGWRRVDGAEAREYERELWDSVKR